MKRALLVGINSLAKAGIFAILLLCQREYPGQDSGGNGSTPLSAYADANFPLSKDANFIRGIGRNGASLQSGSVRADAERMSDLEKGSRRRVVQPEERSSPSPLGTEHLVPTVCGVSVGTESSIVDCSNPQDRNRGWLNAIDAPTYAGRSVCIAGGSGPGRSTRSLESLARSTPIKSGERKTGTGRVAQEESTLPSSVKLSRGRSRGEIGTSAGSVATQALPTEDWKSITSITTERTMTSRTLLPCANLVISRTT